MQNHRMSSIFNLLVDGDVTPDDGVIGELRISTDSDTDAELVRPDVFVLVSRPALIVLLPVAISLISNVRNSLVLLGAMVTAGLISSSFKLDVSKNDPVNESHKLLGVVPVVTDDKIGLLIDCFNILPMSPSLSLATSDALPVVFALNSHVDVDAFNVESQRLPYSSSVMSSALSIVFCASFSAVFARLAIPVASNQLIVLNETKYYEQTVIRNWNEMSAFYFKLCRFEFYYICVVVSAAVTRNHIFKRKQFSIARMSIPFLSFVFFTEFATFSWRMFDSDY